MSCENPDCGCMHDSNKEHIEKEYHYEKPLQSLENTDSNLLKDETPIYKKPNLVQRIKDFFIEVD